ncbi:MAG: ABC transporter, partial [Alphaproteobacteria bacterium]
ARAIIKDSPILLLDEATSALDNENEQFLQKALLNYAKDKTVITIAHKLSSIINVDKIIFVKDGEIVEIGTHQELIKNDSENSGFYKKMYEIELAQS